MTDLLDEQHAQAFLVPLTANPYLGATKVFDGKVADPTPDPPWVLVYLFIGFPYGSEGLGNALDGRSRTITARADCHCVGLNAAAARAVGMQVRSSLLDVRPFITGRICGPIHEPDAPDPPDRDESTGRLVMDWRLSFVFTSTG